MFTEIASDRPKSNEICLAWRNLRYQVSDWSGFRCSTACESKKKPILRRMNGHFDYHSLNGLMGPSGAGKTTLLNTLCGNVRSGLSPESEIYVNSSEPTAVVSFFIEQHVHLTIIGTLTVRQIFQYAFRFKNGLCSQLSLMEQHIDSVMHQLLLPKTLLDNRFHKCSGGEQKRIAIAQELMSLHKPSVLFVDEPTTGLDSAAAFVVMSCLQQMSLQERVTVIASIHLPNHDILSLFHRLYVLARGGVCIYSGSPDMIRLYLERHLSIQITEHQQPIEALIKIACNGQLDPNVVILADECLHSEFAHLTSELVTLRKLPFGLPKSKKFFSISNLLLLFCRQILSTFVSNFRVFLLQVIFYMLIHLIISTLFRSDMVLADGCYRFDPENGTRHSVCSNELSRHVAINENIGYILYLFVILGLISVSASSTLFSSVVNVFRNEHGNRWYSLGVFYTSLTFVSLLEQSLFALLNCTLSYLSTQQHAIDGYSINWTRFGYYYLAVWLNTVYSQSLGQLVGGIIPDQLTSVMLSVTGFTMLAIQSDYFFKTDKHSNAFMRQVANATGLKYLTKLVLYTFYGLDRCDVQKGDVSLVLSEYNIEPEKIGFYVARLLTNIVLVRALTLIYMYIRFNSFADHPLVQFFARRRNQLPSGHHNECIAIDYLTKSINKSNKEGELTLEQIQQAQQINRSLKQDVIQLSCEDFIRNKISIAWKNLTLYASSSIYEIGSVPNSHQTGCKVILRNLSGQFHFGSLNALMGASGAGKTSLLRALNGQLKTQLSENTQFFLSKFVKARSCFITQQVSDHLLPGLTAKQMLVYASRLKNLNEQSYSIDHEAIALNLLDELHLKGSADTKVDRCSGGERKRLALAVELTCIEMPNLICIDEPTSGLDSNSAEIITSCLRKLTSLHPITIIASIHQPNSEVLQMFDQLYILARGGVCVYSGQPSQLSTHLSNVLHMSQILEPKLALESLIRYSCDYESPVVQAMVRYNEQVKKVTSNLKEDTQLAPDGIAPNRKRFSMGAFYILSVRYLTIVRHHLWIEWLAFSVIYFSYGICLLMNWDPNIAYVSGCLNMEDEFNNTCTLSEEKLHQEEQLANSAKFAYFLSSMFVLCSIVQSTLVMHRDVVYFINEHRNGWYSTGSFYLFRSLFDILFMVPVVLLYVYMCNIYEPVRPGIYWNLVLVIMLSLLASQGMSHILVLVSNRNVTLLTMILLGTSNIYQLLSNFFISIQRTHYVYQVISNLVISRFTIESVMLLVYGFGRCDHKQLHPILHLMTLKNQDYYWCLAMILFNVLFYRVVAIALLLCKVNPIENRRQRIKRIRDYQHKIVSYS